MSGSLTSPDDAFFGSIREILAEARRKAATSVNVIMVEAYWRIGARIVEQEQKGEARAAYGKELIKELSRRLGDEFGRGFSIANLKNFRQFYLTFPDSAKGYALRSELGWTHYRLIMRVEEPKARAYYLEAAAGQGWTSRQLERNIRSGWHQRLLKAPEAEREAAPLSPENIFKDPYILEFLNLPEDTKTHERDLESALIDNLQAFLLELGRGFSFVGRQFRISSETSHFYIDLVFYHYLLKCFVLIDLKIDKLAHQDIGQMDMYVRMFDDLKRGADDNPTLGIILCADKDQTIVRYSVLHGNEQLFAAKYLTILPSEAELARELEARHVLDIPTEGGDA
jgi:predicted nuclease of restriction endonuclease-like (RecB) superfamily